MAILHDLADDALWCSRCWFWRDQVNRSRPGRAQNERNPYLLILSGFGVSFRLEGGALKIRNGLTHHPQKAETHRFVFAMIASYRHASSSSIAQAAFRSGDGVVVGAGCRANQIELAGHHHLSVSRERLFRKSTSVEWQRVTRKNPDHRMTFCNKLITEKTGASILPLEKAIRRSPSWENAMKTAYAILTRFDSNPAHDVIELRGIKGSAAAAIFGRGVICLSDCKSDRDDRSNQLGGRSVFGHQAVMRQVIDMRVTPFRPS